MMFRSVPKYFSWVFLLSVFFTSEAFAATPQGALVVSPSFTEVVLDKPTQTEQIKITYKNNSDQLIELELFPIDFRQADRTGTLSFVGAESGSFSYSLASFLSFESNRIQIDPRSEKEFLVSVTNREDLSPGGHYAAVVARLVTDESQSSQAQIAPSISALILLRKVGGERFNMSLSDLDFPQNPISFDYPSAITALFRNEGNVHLVPFGTAEIRDMFGRMIYRGIINTSSLRVFPETRRYIVIDMQKVSNSLPLSVNSVVISGEDSLRKVKYTYTETFLYINPLFIAGLIAVCIVTVIIKKRRPRKKHNIKNK